MVDCEQPLIDSGTRNSDFASSRESQGTRAQAQEVKIKTAMLSNTKPVRTRLNYRSFTTPPTSDTLPQGANGSTDFKFYSHQNRMRQFPVFVC